MTKPCSPFFAGGGGENRLMRFLHVGVVLIACLLWGRFAAAQEVPRTILVLDQSTPFTEYFGKFFATFQSTLRAGSEISPTVHLERLGYTYVKGIEYDALLRSFLRDKYRSENINVIVANGTEALRFALSLQAELDPSTPVAFSGIDDGTAAQLKLPRNVTGTTIHRTMGHVLITAKALVPGLKRIALVGDPLEQQSYRQHYKDELVTMEEDVSFIDFTGLPMDELRKRVAALPNDAAIFYTTLSGTGGARYDPNTALALISEVANRPIVIDQETRLGHGGTGGFVAEPVPIGEATARIVLRLLNGEHPSSIPIAAGDFVKPVFDWRELTRWNVAEDRLPSGSEIRFRQPGLWERYRFQIVGLFAALVLQAVLIGWLIYEIGRRQRAEVQSRSAMAELTYMNRRVAAGHLSAALTHEINQPLAGIATRASAALRWMRPEKNDPEKVRAALEAIVAATDRVANLVTSIRSMFKKDTPEKVSIDVNQIILTALSIVRVELQKHGVELRTQLDEHLPAIQGDKVQLQQVVLNLVLNGIEAMQSVRPRVLNVQTNQPRLGMVRVSVEDSGTGIDGANLAQIFKPLFTTKASGMGMGLFICRSIIESHDGKIWVTAAADRGSIFQFELPIRSTQD
jgi:signal transduction histidine kinase